MTSQPDRKSHDFHTYFYNNIIVAYSKKHKHCTHQVTNLDPVVCRSNTLSVWPQLLLISKLCKSRCEDQLHVYSHKQTAFDFTTTVHVHPNLDALILHFNIITIYIYITKWKICLCLLQIDLQGRRNGFVIGGGGAKNFAQLRRAKSFCITLPYRKNTILYIS